MKEALLSFEKSILNDAVFSEGVSTHWKGKGSIWKRFYKIEKGELSINFEELKCAVENFRYERCLSSGLDDSRDDEVRPKKFFDKMNLMIDEIGRSVVENNISDKNPGNTNKSFNIGKKRTDFAELFFIKWYSDIKDIVFKKTINVVCEIGGGFGGLASVILRNHNAKYIIIDLPQSNLITHYYLSSLFENKKIFSYIDLIGDEITQSDFNKNDIFILPQWVKLSDFISVDFFINTRSMMEMNKNVIEKYFNLIHSRVVGNGYFLNINRYVKNFGDSNNISKFYEYPYDSNWDTVISKESYKQRHMRFLLTKRVFGGFKNHIFSEMEKIKNITEAFL